MGDVSASNFVMEEVNGSPWVQFVVWAIDCVEGTPDEVVVVIGKVWNINVGVLEPIVFRREYMNMRREKDEKKTLPCT